MTLYCTSQDLQDRFGAEELLQLAPGVGGVLDTARVQRACEDAGDLADGYLRARYALPLSAVPRLLVQLTAAIARFELHHGGDRQPTDQATKARDQAVQFLRDVQAGRADLGLAPSGTAPAPDAGTVLATPGRAAITDEDFQSYMGRPGW